MSPAEFSLPPRCATLRRLRPPAGCSGTQKGDGETPSEVQPPRHFAQSAPLSITLSRRRSRVRVPSLPLPGEALQRRAFLVGGGEVKPHVWPPARPQRV